MAKANPIFLEKNEHCAAAQGCTYQPYQLVSDAPFSKVHNR